MRKRTIGVAVVVVGLWWMRGGREDATVAPRVQAGVLPNGFAVLSDRQVRELDRDAAVQHEMTLRLDAEVRLVGTRSGSAVGWKDGKKLKLSTLDNDGKLDDVTTWGKKVTQLCDGAASNEHRFGVAWLESDGGIWFVHGPLGRASELASSVMELEIETAKPNWCGIASADRDIALVWREGAKFSMNFCTEKQCSAYIAKVPVAKDDTLMGFGCVRESCLFATRDPSRTWKLHRVAETGRPVVVSLPNAAPDTSVSIVGAGGRGFAVAYLAKDGRATVERVSVDGAFTHVWHFENSEAPVVRWAADKLLVAFAKDSHVIAMPR